MGLDMYLLSTPKYKNPNIHLTGNDLYVLGHNIAYNKLLESNQYNYKYSYAQYYGHEPKEFPQEVTDFYSKVYDENTGKSEYPKSIFTERAYWRKAYDIANFLNHYYDNLNNDYLSKPINKKIIYELKEFAQSYIDKQKRPQQVTITGYLLPNGKMVTIPESAEALVLQPIGIEDEITMPVDTQFFTSLPLEILAEDDWELGHAMYTVAMCDFLLENFDFENEWLFYLASY